MFPVAAIVRLMNMEKKQVMSKATWARQEVTEKLAVFLSRPHLIKLWLLVAVLPLVAVSYVNPPVPCLASESADSDFMSPTVWKKLYKNLRYSTKSGSCAGDLYIPRKEGPVPLVIVIHAGGWTDGDKRNFDPSELSVKLSIVGFAVYNINYRLVQDGGTFPHSIDDVKDAINFMAIHGADYGIDPKRIALFGISAGANLALMAAYNSDADLPQGLAGNKLKTPIRSVVAYCPVINLLTLDKPFITAYMDDTAIHAAALYKQASPASYVKTAVPTIVIHGTADPLVPCQESANFVRLLQKNGCDAKFNPVPGGVHLFTGTDKDIALKPAVDFLNAHF